MPHGQLDRVPFITIFVSDLEASVSFYESVVGLRRDSYQIGPPSFAVQGTTLVLVQASHRAVPTPEPPPGQASLSLGVANLEEFHKRMVSHGAPVVWEPREEAYGRSAAYRDPDGMRFQVVEKKPDPEVPALVLSGGGALAAFEVGVLSAMAETAAVPAVITGASAGAYNAAFIAAHAGGGFQSAAAQLEQIWTKRIAGPFSDNGVIRIRGDFDWMLDPARFLSDPVTPVATMISDAAFIGIQTVERFSHAFTAKESLFRRAAELINIGDLISAEPMRKLVEETIPADAVLRSQLILKLAATDWETGELRLFVRRPVDSPVRKPGREIPATAENLHHAILASAAIPALFPPVKVGDRVYVDGGVVMNTPLDPAIESGATVIHLVSLNPEVSSIPLDGPENTLQSVERTLTAAVAGNVRSDLKQARLINSLAGVGRRVGSGQLFRPMTIHRYHPGVSNIRGAAGMLMFTPEHIAALIAEGKQKFRDHNCERDKCVLPGDYAFHLEDKTMAAGGPR
ncbi:MAG: hypothetical protein FJW39_09385 [Acidobacteria bacterium]|nr:hypothetical protein [Acidobacteriota bacterium]